MDELACIFTKLELKNATLTAENTRMQKELEAEHALAETLGHGLEQAKDENVKLRELALEIWRSCPVSEDDCAKCPHYIEESEEVSCDIPIRMEKLGIEVDS